jgi:PAS domain S-box-containing protein
MLADGAQISVQFYAAPAERAALVREVKALKAGKHIEREIAFRRRDGSIMTGWIGMRLAHNNGGPDFLEGFVEDISERKKVEEANHRLVVAIDQTAESIVFTDAQGTILYVNQGFENATGYTRQEAIGQNPRMLNSGKQPASYYQTMWKTLNQGEVWHGRFINKRKNGTLYEEEVTISPVHNGDGKIISFVAVKRDISRETQLEQQLFEAQKMEAIGQLAGGVAHDYNNILAASIIQLSLLMADQSLSPEVQEALQDLRKGTDRAASLTRQLLMFSRRQPLQKQSLELNAVLNEELKMLRRLLGEHIELNIRGQTGDAWIEGDPGMIEQVIMNLCINARDAMPDGGRLTFGINLVEFDAQNLNNPQARPGKYVCFSVADKGSGMSAETKARIFEPFFTTKGVGKGTGLGLATVYGIVKQHNGWIEVNSEVGKGSEFRIYLPSSAAKRAVGTCEASSRILPGKETILIVEDDEPVRKSVVLALKFAGYRVFEAGNAPEALELWSGRINQIDLLLTDMVMPGGMSGLAMAEAFKKLNPGLRVILTSGYSNELVVSGTGKHPEFIFVSKPYDIGVLTKTARESLDQKQSFLAKPKA